MTKLRMARRRKRCAYCRGWIRKGEEYVLQLQLTGGAQPVHLRACEPPEGAWPRERVNGG